MTEEFYSFKKAMWELHKTEEELKKLVMEGEILAFRDDMSMKFKKEDIERYKKDNASRFSSNEAPTGELHEELFGDNPTPDPDDFRSKEAPTGELHKELFGDDSDDSDDSGLRERRSQVMDPEMTVIREPTPGTKEAEEPSCSLPLGLVIFLLIFAFVAGVVVGALIVLNS